MRKLLLLLIIMFQANTFFAQDPNYPSTMPPFRYKIYADFKNKLPRSHTGGGSLINDVMYIFHKYDQYYDVTYDNQFSSNGNRSYYDTYGSGAPGQTYASIIYKKFIYSYCEGLPWSYFGDWCQDRNNEKMDRLINSDKRLVATLFETVKYLPLGGSTFPPNNLQSVYYNFRTDYTVGGGISNPGVTTYYYSFTIPTYTDQYKNSEDRTIYPGSNLLSRSPLKLEYDGIEFIKLDPLTTLNPILEGYNEVLNGYLSCDDETLQLDIADSDIDMHFAVDVFVGTTNINLYPYAKRPTRGIDLTMANIQTMLPSFNFYQPFKFKVRYTEDDTIQRIGEDTFTYTYIMCPPALTVGAITQATCYETKNGTVEFAVDRDLYAGEDYYLKNLYLNGNILPPKSINVPDGYEIDTTTDPKKIKITGLQGGKYDFSWQTYMKVNGKDVTTDVKSTPSFIIAPNPVKFEIKQANNPKCNNDPVAIAIAVTGGSGSYKFFVDSKPKTATKEADGYYHIKDLQPAEKNEIKVTDSNNCYEIAP
jgi:hypothetical protein